jgi:hypothetical protein
MVTNGVALPSVMVTNGVALPSVMVTNGVALPSVMVTNGVALPSVMVSGRHKAPQSNHGRAILSERSESKEDETRMKAAYGKFRK